LSGFATAVPGSSAGVQIFRRCAHRFARPEGCQIGEQLAGRGVAQFRFRRQRLDEDAAHRLGTRVRRRGRRDAGTDHALEFFGGLGVIGLKSGNHFMQHYRQRP
jgi:hypothetical protein